MDDRDIQAVTAGTHLNPNQETNYLFSLTVVIVLPQPVMLEPSGAGVKAESLLILWEFFVRWVLLGRPRKGFSKDLG